MLEVKKIIDYYPFRKIRVFLKKKRKCYKKLREFPSTTGENFFTGFASPDS